MQQKVPIQSADQSTAGKPINGTVQQNGNQKDNVTPTITQQSDAHNNKAANTVSAPQAQSTAAHASTSTDATQSAAKYDSAAPPEQSTTVLKDAKHNPTLDNEPTLNVHNRVDTEATRTAIHKSIEHIANDKDVKAYVDQQQQQLDAINAANMQKQRDTHQANAHPAAVDPTTQTKHYELHDPSAVKPSAETTAAPNVEQSAAHASKLNTLETHAAAPV